MPTQQGDNEHPRRHHRCQLGSLYANRLLCCIVREGTLWGMMPAGGGSEIGGRGTGGDDSYNRQVRTSIDNGSCLCPMAAMGPHSRLLSIQQSANILCDRTTLLKLEITIIINVN